MEQVYQITDGSAIADAAKEPTQATGGKADPLMILPTDDAKTVDRKLIWSMYRARISPYAPAKLDRLQVETYLTIMDCSVILAAINDTERAQRPSIYYLLAILRRCQAEGVKTKEDYEARNAKFQRRYRSWDLD